MDGETSSRLSNALSSSSFLLTADLVIGGTLPQFQANDSLPPSSIFMKANTYKLKPIEQIAVVFFAALKELLN